jgi:hypothetical protein
MAGGLLHHIQLYGQIFSSLVAKNNDAVNATHGETIFPFVETEPGSLSHSPMRGRSNRSDIV